MYEQRPEPEWVGEFHEEWAEKLRHPHHIYIAWRGDTPLYVGLSRNVAQRLASHRDKPWLPEVDRVDVYGPFPKWEGMEYERDAIVNLRPVHNKRHHPDRVNPRAVIADSWADAVWDATRGGAA